MRTFLLLFIVGCEATGTTRAALEANDAAVGVDAVDEPDSWSDHLTDAGSLEAATVDAVDELAQVVDASDPPDVSEASDPPDAPLESSCPGVKDPTTPDIPCGCQAAPNDPSCLLDGSDCRWGYSGAGTVCAQECVILRCR